MNNKFKTLSCVHYTIFLVVKLDLFIRALLLDRILDLEKKLRVRLAYILFTIDHTGGIFMCDGCARDLSFVYTPRKRLPINKIIKLLLLLTITILHYDQLTFPICIFINHVNW